MKLIGERKCEEYEYESLDEARYHKASMRIKGFSVLEEDSGFRDGIVYYTILYIEGELQ